jgi:DNA polymerase III epsilon subunit-like protein
MNNLIMVDLETLSVKANAAILTIGAIKFNKNISVNTSSTFGTNLNSNNSFYKRITIESCKEANLDINEDTIKWWNTQEKEAKYEAMLNPDRISLKEGLIEFNKWVGDFKYIKFFANSPDFDITILREAYRNTNLEHLIPFNFWNIRCCRTVYDLGNVRLKDFPNKIQHHALYDCMSQIEALQKAFKNLNN